MIVASWKIEGLFKADAVKVAEEIRSIGKEIKPIGLIEKGRDKNSELHKCFDWNDKTASEKYRLFQARKILNTIIIRKVSEKAEEQTNTRMFSYITTKATEEKTHGVYMQTVTIYKNPDQYQDLLQQALRELESFKRKYQSLKELKELFKVIDEIVK